MTFLNVVIGVGLIVVVFLLLTVLNENRNLKQRLESQQEQTEERDERIQEYYDYLSSLRDKLEDYEKREIDLQNIVDKDTHSETQKELEKTREEFIQLKSKYDSLVSSRKSNEVRLGAIAESLTPFLEGFNHDPKSLRSLGSPIDYVCFEEDGVTFIEVKSGESKLSKKQKHIKELVETGKVSFEIHRIDKNGLSIQGNEKGESDD